ncbi:hypothetical protein KEM54_005694 [Ascosphaera aggregata]|nr:hypothetical protein KEM54_005694 [Ascosphaera aggregata]
MPFNPCPTGRRRNDSKSAPAAVRHRQGSHFEEHAAVGRISEGRNHGKLSGSALQLSAKNEPCPNHPRHPVLLDKSWFAKRQRDQTRLENVDYNDHDVDDDDDDNDHDDSNLPNLDCTADADHNNVRPGQRRLTSRSEANINPSPGKKSSRFSLRSLPSRLFKKHEREKIDFHRLYTETSAADIQRMQEEMSEQLQAMDEANRRASLAVKTKEKDDMSGTHFTAFNKKEWLKESKDSTNCHDDHEEQPVHTSNKPFDASSVKEEKKTQEKSQDNDKGKAKEGFVGLRKERLTDSKGKSRDDSGSQTPQTTLPGSTWKSLGAVVSRTPSRKLTEATAPDKTASAGAAAASHGTSTSTTARENQPSRATVIASVRAIGGGSGSGTGTGTGTVTHKELKHKASTEFRKSLADDEAKTESSPARARSKKSSRSRKSNRKKKDQSNPFLTQSTAQSSTQAEEPVMQSPTPRDASSEAAQLDKSPQTSPREGSPEKQTSPPAQLSATVKEADKEADKITDKKADKGKEGISEPIRGQIPSRPLSSHTQEDTISVSRARTDTGVRAEQIKQGASSTTTSRNVSLQAAKWESLMRRDKETFASPSRSQSRSQKEGKKKEGEKKTEDKSRAAPPSASATQKQESSSHGVPISVDDSKTDKPARPDPPRTPVDQIIDDNYDTEVDTMSKSNQQQPPVAPPNPVQAAVGQLIEDIPVNVPLMSGTADGLPGPEDSFTDVDVAEVEVEDDEGGESVHMRMGERLRMRKKRVASGLDKVIKGLQKRALSAARAQNAQLQALLGQDKKKEEASAKEKEVAQEESDAWLTDGRRKGYGYHFIDGQQEPQGDDGDDGVIGGVEVEGDESDKENTGPVYYTPVPPQERERPEAPSYSWPGRSGATEDSVGIDPESVVTNGLNGDGDADTQDVRKADKERRWFSLGNGSFRRLVSEKVNDVIRAGPTSIQRAISNTSLAASMLSDQQQSQQQQQQQQRQPQGEVPPQNRSVLSLTASLRTGKSDKSNGSVTSVSEPTQEDPVFSPPPQINSPVENKLLSANSVYSFGEDLERQLSSINLSDIECTPSRAEDTTPRPRTATNYTMNPTETGVQSAGPRKRTPLGAGPNANALLRPQNVSGVRIGTGSNGGTSFGDSRSRTGSSGRDNRSGGGQRSRAGTGSSVSAGGGGRQPGRRDPSQHSSSVFDDRRDGLHPPALHPRSQHLSSPKAPPRATAATTTASGASTGADIAMNQEMDVRGSTAAFREKQIVEAQNVKEQLYKLVDGTWHEGE